MKTKSIKDRLSELSVEDMSLLQYAFENQIGQYVKLPAGKFIGVCVDHIQHLRITDNVGVWSYGDDMERQAE